MTVASSARGILGDADRRDCCPALCDYRPDGVRLLLDIVLAHERQGTSPVEPLRRRSRDTSSSSSAPGDGDERIWDVQQAVQALRAERKEVTAVSVAQRLCPWALD